MGSIAIGGSTKTDFAQSNTCGSRVDAGKSCTISVTFTPIAVGARAGTVTITDNAAGSPQTLTLSGTGTSAVVSLSPQSLTFSGQIIGTSSPTQSVMLSNMGNAS